MNEELQLDSTKHYWTQEPFFLSDGKTVTILRMVNVDMFGKTVK